MPCPAMALHYVPVTGRVPQFGLACGWTSAQGRDPGRYDSPLCIITTKVKLLATAFRPVYNSTETGSLVAALTHLRGSCQDVTVEGSMSQANVLAHVMCPKIVIVSRMAWSMLSSVRHTKTAADAFLNQGDLQSAKSL